MAKHMWARFEQRDEALADAHFVATSSAQIICVWYDNGFWIVSEYLTERPTDYEDRTRYVLPHGEVVRIS